MVTVGIDAGAEYLKIVLLNDSTILSHSTVAYGGGSLLTASGLLKELLNKVGLNQCDINHLAATGVERESISMAEKQVPTAICCAKGINHLFPSVRTVVDMGADKTLALRCEGGKAIATASNDRCAAMTGRYLRMVSDLLNIGIDEMGQLSLLGNGSIKIRSTCAVFAETEIISLIHQKRAVEDILKAVFESLISRVYPLLLKVSFCKDIAVIGGLAKNVGITESFRAQLGFSAVIPEEPGIIGALGAAIIACCP